MSNLQDTVANAKTDSGKLKEVEKEMKKLKRKLENPTVTTFSNNNLDPNIDSLKVSVLNSKTSPVTSSKASSMCTSQPSTTKAAIIEQLSSTFVQSTAVLASSNPLPCKSPRRSSSPCTPPGTPPPHPASVTQPSTPHTPVPASWQQPPPVASGSPQQASSDNLGLSENDFEEIKQMIQDVTDRFCDQCDEIIHS